MLLCGASCAALMYNSRTSLYIEFDIIELFNVGLRADESSVEVGLASKPLYLQSIEHRIKAMILP